jgi:hypothetical protein
MSDVATGHSPVNVARAYEQPTLQDMTEALKQIPRCVVNCVDD